jgi:hypothetical protein
MERSEKRRIEDLIPPKTRLSGKDLLMRTNIQGGAVTFKLALAR